MKLDHVSTYLILLTAGMTATQMHPSATSFFVYVLTLAMLFLIRAVAHREARS